MHKPSLVSGLVLTSLLSSPLLAADLFVGPVGSGAPFSEIHSAVAAAAPGDTIHVAPGAYGVFTIDKPLRVVGAGSSLVTVQDDVSERPVVIEHLAGTALLSGLTILEPLDATAAFATSTLRISDVSGQVLVHDVHALPVPGGEHVFQVVHVLDAAQVFFQNCYFVGEEEGSISQAGGRPLELERSNVWIADSTLIGGDNADDLAAEFPFPGAAGLTSADSNVSVARSVLRGGNGGSSSLFLTANEAGGSGLYADGGVIRIAGGPGNLIQGGDAGTGQPLGQVGGPGVSLGFSGQVFHASDVAFLPGVSSSGVTALNIATGGVFGEEFPLGSRSATLGVTPAQVSLGTPLTLELAGNPGGVQLPFLAVSSGPALTLPGIDGAWVLDLVVNLGLGSFGLDPIDGMATTAVIVPNDPVLSGRAVLLQSFELSGAYLGFSNLGLAVIEP